MGYLFCREWNGSITYLVSYQENKSLEAPIPWVGMYIAAASAACSLAMAADVFKGFISKKLWFPCKYFSLNAASLTLLAVSMKLPTDFRTVMSALDEKIARVSSLVLMSTAMGNFMTSLGSFDSNEILLNITALGIFVITIVGNVYIQICAVDFRSHQNVTYVEEIVATVFMLLLLVTFCFSTIMVPTAKKYIEAKYQEMRKTSSSERVEGVIFTIDELRVVVKKHWVMAETGSPQFVIARSVTCVAPGIICLLMALTLVEVQIRMTFLDSNDGRTQNYSSYNWSIRWILVTQWVGVILGNIAPVFRWFNAVRFKCSKPCFKVFKEEFKVETYWTQRLVDWRESSLSLQIRHYKCRKLLHDAKRLALNSCIGIQILIVIANKLLLHICASFACAIFLCFRRMKKIMICDSGDSNNMGGLESRAITDLDFNNYVLLLEGEAELSKKTLTIICSEVDKVIENGKRQQPKNLIKLLDRCEVFKGVREFDSNEVQNLHSREPPNCWSLPVVTLTSIAIALPNIAKHKAKQLLSSVSEGLSLVKLIDKTLDISGELASIRDAAAVVWVGVELYKKWQDKDLQSVVLHSSSYKDVLQELSDRSEKIVTDFKITKDSVMENPLNWPIKVLAANSMYRISQTILLAHKDDNHQTDQELFERLSIMISEILAACLTNLSHVITMKCHSNAIKEREKNVHQAAILLGESEEILKILQSREWPNLGPGKAANIDEWRAFMEKDAENPQTSISTSIDETSSPQPNGDHTSFQLDA